MDVDWTCHFQHLPSKTVLHTFYPDSLTSFSGYKGSVEQFSRQFKCETQDIRHRERLGRLLYLQKCLEQEIRTQHVAGIAAPWSSQPLAVSLYTKHFTSTVSRSTAKALHFESAVQAAAQDALEIAASPSKVQKSSWRLLCTELLCLNLLSEISRDLCENTSLPPTNSQPPFTPTVFSQSHKYS